MKARVVKLTWFTCLTVVLFAPGAERAMAQQLVQAKILSVQGPVEIRRSPSTGASLTKITFKPSDQLKAGDLIVTGSLGRLVLRLTDGSQAIISERSMVEVRDLSNSPRELFQILRGKTRVYIEKLGGRPNPYRIDSPTAVIAVRGTLFDVIVKSNQTEVFVHEGGVDVSASLLPDQRVFLSAGQMTRVKREEPPTPPASFKPGRNDDSFRPVVETRPVAENFDLSDRRTIDRDILSPRATTPVGRQGSTSPTQPISGQRSPTRRP